MSNRTFADISSNDREFNAAQYAAAGHLLVAIKATEGTDYINPRHRSWCLHAGLHHVAVAHYHFARPDWNDVAETEAKHFLEAALPLAGGRDYLVLDLERATAQGWSHDPAWSFNFDKYVQAHSRFRTILYASAGLLRESDGWLAGDDRRVWCADWSDAPNYAPPGYNCIFRQYTDGVHGPAPHVFAGIGRCDGNIMSRQTYNHLAEAQPCAHHTHSQSHQN